MSSDLTPQEQLDRTDVLDDLLRLDGRCDPTHPLRSTYTGLARPFLRLMLLEAEVAELRRIIDELSGRIGDRIDAEPPADA
jgi:hypothetical protein